jgi:hypothetical protein
MNATVQMRRTNLEERSRLQLCRKDAKIAFPLSAFADVSWQHEVNECPEGRVENNPDEILGNRITIHQQGSPARLPA